ncbi:MAG: hypothetical protein KIS82_09990 [Ferruginibacter sp.]|nr:hypothetical protein [Ferruginibacter sp.]
MNKFLHRFLLLSLSISTISVARAQLFINNGQLTIESGASVVVQGNITSNTNILGDGKIVLKGSSAQQVDMSNFIIPRLEIDNVSNASLVSGLKIGSELIFTNGNLSIGNNDMTLLAPATVTNPANNKFVVTDGTGKMIKSSLGSTAFTFPVGNAAVAYNPVSISNAGTVDDIGVRANANVLVNGNSGASITKEVVDASWDISEAINGGSNLSITASWAGADELPGFNRNKTGISYYITAPAANLGWDLLNNQTSAATGGNPYSVTRTGISNLGTFAVGNRPVLSPLLVSPKVFLQGAYSGTNMTDLLRTKNLIPTTEPYSSITGFTQSGSGGGETTTAAIVGSGAPASNDAIVDWVFVQLHDGTTGDVISTRSALLQRDGDIVETDGVSPLNMAGNAAGSYYISVRHRNHLGIRTPASFGLAKTTTTAYNFTDNISKAYTNGTTPIRQWLRLLPGFMRCTRWNANSNTATRITGSISVSDYQRILSTLAGAALPSNVYSPSDINMDGNVRVSGSISVSDYQKTLSFLNSLSIINQHL